MSDIDLTDDWMNPPPSRQWVHKKPENKTVYIIERAKREICFGDPGYIVRWEEWSRHETAAERDSVLASLARDHPAWQLRAHAFNPYLERLTRHL